MEKTKDNYQEGLTSKEIKQRIKKKLVNYDIDIKTKSIVKIIFDNFFTMFNFLNLCLGLLIIFVESYKNLLFLGGVFFNLVIGIIYEVNAKRIIDRLSIIHSTKVKVIRDGIEKSIRVGEIVLDEIIHYKNGNQIVVDSIIISGECEVNEALITGESDLVYKKEGDTLLSGSFIAGGQCYSRCIHIGKNNYHYMITKNSRCIKKVESEIMRSLNKILQVVAILIIPLGSILFYQQFNIPNNNFTVAVVNTVAALVGMIPEGLILLTSIVLAIGIIRLSKYNALVQELYAIEMLARINVLCLDKTGTITKGKMQVDKIIPYQSDYDLPKILSNIGYYLEDDNATIKAIRDEFNLDHSFTPKKIVPFSSSRKYSGITFKEGTFILGAPDVLLKDTSKINRDLQTYQGNRIVLLGFSKESFSDFDLPDHISVLGLIIIKDIIKKDAKEILEFFKNNDVILKIISGDSTKTVSNIAREVGFVNYDKCIDGREIVNNNLESIVNKYHIFGRVKPEVKQQIIEQLRKSGYIVAMVGDGVNDVLALATANCGIAMKGDNASSYVSKVVLLDGNFSSMPKIVLEGRRIINNLERSATLFLNKTFYSIMLSILFIFINKQYPFIPIQLTLTSSLTIGIPAFVLAFTPNHERIKGNFLKNIVVNSIPSSVVVVINIALILFISGFMNFSQQELSTLAVMMNGFIGFRLLYKISWPFDLVKGILFLSLSTTFVLSLLFLRDFFSFSYITLEMLTVGILLMFMSLLLYKILDKIIAKVTN